MAAYSDPALTQLYELLFCDRPELFATGNGTGFPVTQESSDEDLLGVVTDAQAESRLRLLASRILSGRGLSVEPILLGVVAEIGLDTGLDTLAAYLDGTARYMNFAGHVIIWDAPDGSLNELIAKLMQQSSEVVTRIGPWDGLRKLPPGKGIARLSFLMTDGLYFGEGPVNALFQDPMAGPVLTTMTEVMEYLTSQSRREQPQV